MTMKTIVETRRKKKIHLIITIIISLGIERNLVIFHPHTW
jgi:hypothetical protein